MNPSPNNTVHIHVWNWSEILEVTLIFLLLKCFYLSPFLKKAFRNFRLVFVNTRLWFWPLVLEWSPKWCCPVWVSWATDLLELYAFYDDTSIITCFKYINYKFKKTKTTVAARVGWCVDTVLPLMSFLILSLTSLCNSCGRKREGINSRGRQKLQICHHK